MRGEDTGVTREALREVCGQGRVVVDVAAFGGFGHYCCGAFCGEGGGVENVGFGVGGAGKDLVEGGVPKGGCQRE